MDITLRQLEIFQAVVVAGSITKASRRIGLSQPSISQQLAKLEENLGSPLIKRNRTGLIGLTPAGEYWFKSGAELLRRLEGAVDEHNHRFVHSSAFVRMGVTATLRGRFAAVAGRIASEQPGFIKFELRSALASFELVEQLRLHQINYAVVSEEAIDGDRNSFHVAHLFDDPFGWVVPASVPLSEIHQALTGKADVKDLSAPLRHFVEVGPNPSLRVQSDDWYRHKLPGAAPTFAASNYATAVDLVAENLATAHTPLSLLPSLSPTTRERVRIVPIDVPARSIVLGMPKHLYTLPAYANIFRRIVEFSRTDYAREMLATEADGVALVG